MCIVYKLSILNLDVKTFFFISVYLNFFWEVSRSDDMTTCLNQVFDIHDLEATNMQGNHQI